MKKFIGILVIAFLFSGSALASMSIDTKSARIPIDIKSGHARFSENASYQVCFTPGGQCTEDIVSALAGAKKTIYVQAYSFTSAPIAQALLDAKTRGVDVKVILDKSQYAAEKYSSSKFLANHGIPVWIDYRPSIAHNKVVIVDERIVVTGSFNFTRAAQEHNAENLLIISDTALASQYLQNWIRRRDQSAALEAYLPKQRANR